VFFGFLVEGLTDFLVNFEGSEIDCCSSSELDLSDDKFFLCFSEGFNEKSLKYFLMNLDGSSLDSSSELDSLSFDFFFCSLKLDCFEDIFLFFEDSEMKSLSSSESDEFCSNFFEKVLFCFENLALTHSFLDKEETEFAFSSSLSELEVL
jgi:hypothetical protein